MTTTDLLAWIEREAREVAWELAHETTRGQASITVEATYDCENEYVDVDGTCLHNVSPATWDEICEDGESDSISIEVERKHWAEALEG